MPKNRHTLPLNAAVVAVVDDDWRILESLDSLLASAGYVVRAYSSAEEFVGTRPFLGVDCLVSDIGMPGMGGLGLLHILRAERPGLPVIIITASHEERTRAAALALGVQFIFRKPFDEIDLLDAIQKVVVDTRRK